MERSLTHCERVSITIWGGAISGLPTLKSIIGSPRSLAARFSINSSVKIEVVKVANFSDFKTGIFQTASLSASCLLWYHHSTSSPRVISISAPSRTVANVHKTGKVPMVQIEFRDQWHFR